MTAEPAQRNHAYPAVTLTLHCKALILCVPDEIVLEAIKRLGQGSLAARRRAELVAHGLVDVVLEGTPLERRIDSLGGLDEDLIHRLPAVEVERPIRKLRAVEQRVDDREEELLARV